MRRIFSVACVCAMIIGGGMLQTALAEDGSAEDAAGDGGNWDVEVEASAAKTSGNTENTQLGLKGKFQRQIGRFIHVVSGNVDYAEQVVRLEDEDVSRATQDRWMASYQVDAQLRDRTHGYARVQYDEDRFSGFNKRWFAGVGLGHDIFDSEQLTWSVEAGPGYRWAELEPSINPVLMDRESQEFAAYADSDLDVHIRENVSLEQNANVTYAQSNTTYDTLIGVRTKLTNSVSSKLSYQVKYETDPPQGRESRDTMLKASLLLGF